MKRFSNFILLGLIAFMLTGCESIFNFSSTKYCSVQQANQLGFKHGLNDASRQDNFGYSCTEVDTANINAAYLRGYDEGAAERHLQARAKQTRTAYKAERKRTNKPALSPRPAPKAKKDPNARQCVRAGGKKVCGYHCTKTGNTAKCAPTPKQRCVSNEFGQVACGYNCKKTVKGVACGISKQEKCLTDVLGNITCGNNCRSEGGQVICS